MPARSRPRSAIGPGLAVRVRSPVLAGWGAPEFLPDGDQPLDPSRRYDREERRKSRWRRHRLAGKKCGNSPTSTVGPNRPPGTGGEILSLMRSRLESGIPRYATHFPRSTPAGTAMTVEPVAIVRRAPLRSRDPGEQRARPSSARRRRRSNERARAELGPRTPMTSELLHSTHRNANATMHYNYLLEAIQSRRKSGDSRSRIPTAVPRQPA